MNDFVIQGVTILGTETSSHNSGVFQFVLCVLLSLAFLFLWV